MEASSVSLRATVVQDVVLGTTGGVIAQTGMSTYQIVGPGGATLSIVTSTHYLFDAVTGELISFHTEYRAAC
jgi:uncharacterized membrane protein YeaQ/YmgE (transglycosylase-associated protein family)